MPGIANGFTAGRISGLGATSGGPSVPGSEELSESAEGELLKGGTGEGKANAVASCGDEEEPGNCFERHSWQIHRAIANIGLRTRNTKVLLVQIDDNQQ